ncbi:hypothetical protein GGR51DRAFT_550436 [Nemania sp. FL0031]|nr:hypothetical protein GGR51DRAFT_550436 [Nemania sp. FL0031]
MEPLHRLTRAKTISEQWGFKKHWRTPYLRYLQIVSSGWPQLRPLVDFMEVGTDPSRWRNFFGNDKKNAYTYPDSEKDRKIQQSHRVKRTHVRQLEYLSDGKTELIGNYTTPEQLGDALAALSINRSKGSTGGDVKLKLFVVEDLSREVIERLGYHFDIDPDFFRAHIFDYAWYNIRDPFWDPPFLHIDSMRKDWCQVRFCRVRYFPSPALFNQAQDAANKFNIGRKLYDDENKAFWDTDIPPKLSRHPLSVTLETRKLIGNWSALLGMCSSKEKPLDLESQRDGSRGAYARNAEAKLKQLHEEMIDGKVGLMRTRATFWRRKGEEGDYDVGVLLLDPTIKEGFPLWRGHRNWDPMPSARRSDQATAGNETGPQAERSFFEDFVHWAQRPVALSNSSLNPTPEINDIPLLALLRLVCAEWLTLSEYIKTRLSQIDWEITNPNEFLTQTQIDTILRKLHTWRRLVPLYREMLSETKSRVCHVDSSDSLPSASPLNAYKREFSLVLEQMEEYEERIDRLTTVVTSAISIKDSRRVERLTLLATLFVPLSLVGTLFSMSGNIAQIGATFGYWAAASLVLLVALLAWARLTGSRRRMK